VTVIHTSNGSQYRTNEAQTCCGLVVKQLLRPCARRELAEWVHQVYQMSQRRVSTANSHRADGAPLRAPPPPAGGLADTSERAGRQTVCATTTGAHYAAQTRRLVGRIYRPHSEEGLIVRTRKRQERRSCSTWHRGRRCGRTRSANLPFCSGRTMHSIFESLHRKLTGLRPLV